MPDAAPDRFTGAVFAAEEKRLDGGSMLPGRADEPAPDRCADDLLGGLRHDSA